ncbi:hypothetical protein QNO21_09555 [Microbacterium sp. zg-Y818]|uniref:hypothetical protein n=1 Tax=unclassified Microbacterium TaxID=2609290 RepID=UPI00214BE709|nr:MULTISPECIES: hypothetical protein [unclassified Microbacterium]MCR2799369.1 hypothetical protein [Microbacterium sp. zg.Y818]WIM21368.1 hypothetical protein QNO21_09555 [Microbacterium sp. zg-Y818]
MDDALANDQGAQGLTADMTVRDWLIEPQGRATLAAALATAGLSLDALRPLSGFTIRSVAAMVGGPLQPVDELAGRARENLVSEDWGAHTHWASAALGRQPSSTTSV